MTMPLLQRLSDIDEMDHPSLSHCIKQDLAGLLNSICWFDSTIMRELTPSIVQLGLNQNQLNRYYNLGDIQGLCQDIEELIRHYEPRLKHVHVDSSSAPHSLQLQLYITAQLAIKNKNLAVTFNSYLNPVNMSFQLL